MQQFIGFQRQDCKNPHIQSLLQTDDDLLCVRTIQPDGSYPLYQYQILGLQDLFLSFAGKFSQNHKIHKLLSELNAGDELNLRQDSEGCKLYYQNQPVAALSRQFSRNFEFNSTTPDPTVRILAMITRKRENSEESYQKKHRCDHWVLPVVEKVDFLYHI